MIVRVTELREEGPVTHVVLEGRQIRIEKQVRTTAGRKFHLGEAFDLKFEPYVAPESEPEQEEKED